MRGFDPRFRKLLITLPVNQLRRRAFMYGRHFSRLEERLDLKTEVWDWIDDTRIRVQFFPSLPWEWRDARMHIWSPASALLFKTTWL